MNGLSFKVVALIPHGNIQAQLEKERSDLCKKHHAVAFYPLMCPLAFYSQQEKTQNVLTFADFFKHKKPILKINMCEQKDNLIYRKLPIIDFFLPEQEFACGEFVLKTQHFLFAHSKNQLQLESKNITVTVFKLAQFDFLYTQKSNPQFEWILQDFLWVKP